MPETYGSFERILYALVQRMRRITWMNRILQVVLQDNVKLAGLHMLNVWYSLFASKEMKRARRYFSEEKVNQVCSVLFDEESRNIYRNEIMYRKTRKEKYWPCQEKGWIYFPSPIIKVNEHEVFVDCGAYDGTDSRHFQEKAGNQGWDGIVIFEPDAGKIKQIRKRVGGHRPGITIEECGVWEIDGMLYLKGQGLETTALSEQYISGAQKVPVKAIDHCPGCEKATFIKMDIEGAELPALKGAKETIRNNKPKLAISIYHTDRDMVQIPLYLHKLVPDYRLYVRHHGPYPVQDTVLYAVYGKPVADRAGK